MWRSTRQVSVRYSLLLAGKRQKDRHPLQSRPQSTSSSGSGSAKTIAVAAGVTAVGVGGTLAYAKFDANFRRQLEGSLPYGDSLLGSILGPANEPVRPLPAEKVREKALESSLLRKKAPVEPSRGELKPALPPPPPITAPSQTSVKEKTPSPRDLEAEAQKQLRDIKERNERLNFALEQSLREAQAEVERHTKDAVVAQLAAKEAAQAYAQKLYRAIDEARDDEDQYMWEEALQAKEAKLAAVHKAAVKSEQAWKSLENLRNAIKKGQENKDTQNNLALGPADHAATVARDQLRSAESESRPAKEAAKTASDYRDAVEQARLHFQKEIEALLPETKFTEGQKLSEDELNLLLAHAHRKIENLTKAHVKMQVTEHERAQLFQKQQERISRDLERQRAELDAMLEVKLVKQQEAFEQELQQQLRRQVAAHTEHLREALDEQREDLFRAFGIELEKKLVEERAHHNAALASSVAKLQGMEDYLKARDELDRLSQQAKGLWLACQGLQHTLVHGGGADGPQSLAADLQLVERLSAMSPYVPLVLASLPPEALVRGVYPEVALKERFAQVERACRRVALVDDQGTSSLLRYLASYLQSIFIVYPKELPEEELSDEQRVNPAQWDTFDVLSRVRYWLQHEDLEQALRYASQLRGQPRLVAHDWVRELRLHLEARQAAAALMAFAAATIAEDAEQ